MVRKNGEFGKLIPEKYWYVEGNFGRGGGKFCLLYRKTQFKLGKIRLASWEINIFSSCGHGQLHMELMQAQNQVSFFLKQNTQFQNLIQVLLISKFKVIFMQLMFFTWNLQFHK